MITPENAKATQISHLNYCLEKLVLKDNGYNEVEIARLYRLIYRVVEKMKTMNALDALAYFNENINDSVRKSLEDFNIELAV